MGNINNLWYIKDSGGDWASTKCELDDCYSIPFDPAQDDSLYLQADLPNGYSATEVWLSDLDGNWLQEILSMTDWKIITGDGWNRLIFKVPQNSYACKGVPEEQEICTADLLRADLPPYHIGLVNNYLSGLYHTVIYLHIGGVYYDIDGPLPPGYERIGPTKFRIPCDVRPGSMDWQVYSDVGNGNVTWPYFDGIKREHITVYVPLDCFRFEVPLIKDGRQSAILASEPFHCPNCEETLKISSDYCLSRTDIFGTFIFNTTGFGNTQYGGLTTAKNDLRIQAVLKKMPSELKQERNIRCNNFKSKITRKYELQGAMPTDYPDYMVRMIESIFSGKMIYINGEEYIPDADVIFTERNVAGRSMKKLNVVLNKCEKGMVYDCGCHRPSCDDNPVHAFMLVLAAPDIDNMYGMDRSYVYAEILGLGGGLPPYSIDGWYCSSGSPDSTFFPFDPHAEKNIFRRTDLTGAPAGMSVIAYVTDARGCTYLVGNTVDREDLTCVGYDAHFEAAPIGPGMVVITNILPSYVSYDISLTGFNTIFASGLTSHPYIMTGVPTGVQSISIRIHCGGDGGEGFIGPLRVTVV